MKLSKKLLSVLVQYKDTNSGHFMEGIKGSGDLSNMDLLEWHGTQYGCHFYSITDAGRAALANRENEVAGLRLGSALSRTVTVSKPKRAPHV